jgi:hypothetical protein
MQSAVISCLHAECRHAEPARADIRAAVSERQVPSAGARRAPRRPRAGRRPRAARRHLSSRLFNSPHATFNPLYDFLRTLQNNGEPLMIGKRLSDVEAMQRALTAAEKLLLRCDAQVAPRPPRPAAHCSPCNEKTCLIATRRPASAHQGKSCVSGALAQACACL